MSPDYISTKYPITKKIIDRLKKTGYKNPVQISLDSLSDSVLQDLLGVTDSYANQMKRSLQLLDRSGLNYHVASVLTRDNEDLEVWIKLFDFLSGLKNITEWRICPVNNSIMLSPVENARVKLSKKRVESVYEFIEKNLSGSILFPIVLNQGILQKVFYKDKGGSGHFSGSDCSALNTHLFILPDGKVTICEQLYWNPRFIIGNVNKSSLLDVWNSPQALYLANLERKMIQQKSPCHTCEIFESCYSARNRCWTDVIKAYGEDNWDFPDPRCEKAPLMHSDLLYE